MSHLKSLHTPRQWRVQRKQKRYIVCPEPSGHPRELSLPLIVVLRDMLNVGKTTHELKRVMIQGAILVDGKKIDSARAAIGLFDVLSVSEVGQYRIIMDKKGRLHPIHIAKSESALKIGKVASKRATVGGKIQITLHDGHTMHTDAKVDVGDSVLVQVPEYKIMKIAKPTKGASICLIKGKHCGMNGKLIEIHQQKVVYEDSDGKKYTTRKDYIVVVGEDKAFITAEEKQ